MGVGMALRPLGGKVEERAVIAAKKRIQILIIMLYQARTQ